MEGYFFIADLLGFSRIIKNSPEENVALPIEAWVELIENTAAKFEITQLQLISDTVFAATESSADGLTTLVKFARSLLSDGLRKSLPIRGAITHGTYQWGRLTYGKAVISAHELEMTQDWIGVGCENELPHLTGAWGLDSLVCFPLPMKRGPVKLHPVVAWDVPEFKTLVSLLCRKGLAQQGEILGWEWGQKVNNSVQFGMYLRILTATKDKGTTFHGLLPLEAIEMNLFGDRGQTGLKTVLPDHRLERNAP